MGFGFFVLLFSLLSVTLLILFVCGGGSVAVDALTLPPALQPFQHLHFPDHATAHDLVPICLGSHQRACLCFLASASFASCWPSSVTTHDNLPGLSDIRQTTCGSAQRLLQLAFHDTTTFEACKARMSRGRSYAFNSHCAAHINTMR